MATRAAAWLGVAGVLLGAVALAGCGGKAKAPAADADEGKAPEAGAPAAAPAANPGTPAPGRAQADPFLNQPFAEATVADPPDGQELPDKTLTGKSVGKLYTEVVGLWDKIPFTTDAGKPLGYRAVLDTELGAIEIALRPDLAPNHVRSFVALARAGYFDGLVFERTAHEESEDKDGPSLDYIEAGCPLGTGDANYGSIGYWLKPEFSDKVAHEEGTVGAWHVQEADTAACKFYITLTRAPVMDGNWTVFGKVTRGLDVARAIHRRPVRNDEFKDRPEHPVVIRKVTILAAGADR